MSLLDRLRVARPDAVELDDLPTPPLNRWQAAGLGVATAAVGLLLLALLALGVWVADPRSTGTPWEALAGGAGVWLLGGGAHVTVGVVPVSLVPLGLLCALVLLARSGAGRVLLGSAPEDTRGVLGAWLLGYAGVGAGAAALAFAGPARPGLLSLAIPILLVPVVGGLWAAARVGSALADLTAGASVGWERVPQAIVKGVAPGLRGAAVALIGGTLLAGLLVIVSWGRVTTLQSALGVGVVGGGALALLQLAALPNIGLWVVSFAAGPGFQVIDGARTTWSGSESGLLPMVPVLAAMPPPQPFPAVLSLVVLLPLGLGFWIGEQSLGQVARLSQLRTKAQVAVAAACTAALAVGLLNLVAGGALGEDALAAVGAPTLWLTLCLAAEFAVGALVAVAVDGWRLRR